MKLNPISNSSNIKSCGYDPSTQKLTIEFHSGAKHSYSDVPPELHDKFMASDSKGKFFHANILKGGYKSEKHDDE